jgi:hypothetical protein
MKANSLKEPLIDVVDSKQVITKSDCIKTMDLRTCTVEDVTKFSSKFDLVVEKTDIIHAIVCYFDIGFTCGHKKAYFSTGPHAKCNF